MPSPFEVNQGVGSPLLGGGGNPMEWMNSLNTFQQGLMQNRQTQMSWMANQALGEIIAHAPSLEEGIAEAQKNPAIMGNATEGMKNLGAFRNLEVGTELTKQQTLTSEQQAATSRQSQLSTQQDMFTSALDKIAASFIQGYNDPPRATTYPAAIFAGLDPGTQERTAPYVKSMIQGLEDKLKAAGGDPNSPKGAAAIKSYIVGLVGQHMDPDKLKAITGGLTMVGGQPVQVPGQVIQSQLPPGGVDLSSIGRGPQGPQGPGPQAPAPAPTVTNPVNSRTYPVDTSAKTDYFVTNPDGSVRMNAVGQPTYRTPEIELAGRSAAEGFAKDAETSEQSRAMYSTLEQLHAGEKDLAERGGFTVQGFQGKFRGQISNMLETASNMGWISLDHEADLRLRNLDVGEINKQQGNLIFNLKNSLDPGARSLGSLMEAATVVPGMDQTPLQGMVLTAGLKGLAGWKAGEFRYEQEYLKQNGTLLGAKDSYAKVTSPIDETRAELNKEGMDITPDHHFRFLNDGAAVKAFSEGLLGPRDKDNLGKVFISGLLGDINSDKAAETYKIIRSELNKK